MSYPQYQDDLNLMLESKILGLAVFSTAARLIQYAPMRKKWLALADLEEQMLQRLRECLAAHSLNASVRPWVRLQGVALGQELAELPWDMSMQRLHDETMSVIWVTERLAFYADGDIKTFFQELWAHQQHIINFALAEQDLVESESRLAFA